MRFLGVDTGGTFTDFILVDNGHIQTLKIPSTPADPSRAFLTGLSLMGGKTPFISHGSTVATNALLEGKVGDVLLVITHGFRDILTLGRQNRPRLYSLHPVPERLNLPLERIIEVRERTLADGRIFLPLSESEVQRVLRFSKTLSCTSVAICLLHSYANPEHEKILENALSGSGFQVSRSSAILPEYREFERASTTVVNALVSPVMTRYLERLEKHLSPSVLKVMQSNGGTMSSAAAGHNAVHTVLSGPAGGMVGAFHVASTLGMDRILTFDMGGTSTDVGLCDGSIPTNSQTTLAGWALKIPMIDIHTIGAGGGSIAALDSGGALRVGPQSAAAEPGPACYGRGDVVTVTDANLFLGRLVPDNFLAPGSGLNLERCRLLMEDLARRSGLDPDRLAEGIVEVIEENMAAALRVVSVERGHDPREFTLFSFGGAGGLHACALAEKLAIGKVFIPLFPGLLSAVGMLLAPPMRDYSVSFLSANPPDPAGLDSAFQALATQARQEMLGDGVEASELTLEPSLDLRYRGQSFEVNVPFVGDFVAAFHERYAGLYGHCHSDRETEIVTLRLKAFGKGLEPGNLKPGKPSGPRPSLSETPVVWKGKTCLWKVLWREQLACGKSYSGPALVLEDTATHLLPPGWLATPDRSGHLILEKSVDV